MVLSNNKGKNGKDKMKTVVCFGDSNTWGADPLRGLRFSLMQRWPGVLRNELGVVEYWVIEEGLCGRTAICEDPIEGYKCGKDYIIPCIQSHSPVDLLKVMLGTNDLIKRFSLPTCDIAKGVGILVDLVRKSCLSLGISGTSSIVDCTTAPPPILEVSRFKEIFEGGAEKSQKFGTYYADIARIVGCHFIDAGKIISSSKDDGIHFDAVEHEKLGKAVSEKVKEIFG
jgi:lysophospholipase L1-like esterase